MQFGDRLKTLRKERGITQEQLAVIIGVERSSIGKYEGKSKIVPSDDVKAKIAEYFSVSVDYLLGRTDLPAAAPVSTKENQPAAFSGSELDESLVSDLTSLSPQEVQRVLDFIAGLKASRKE